MIYCYSSPRRQSYWQLCNIIRLFINLKWNLQVKNKAHAVGTINSYFSSILFYKVNIFCDFKNVFFTILSVPLEQGFSTSALWNRSFFIFRGCPLHCSFPGLYSPNGHGNPTPRHVQQKCVKYSQMRITALESNVEVPPEIITSPAHLLYSFTLSLTKRQQL